ncbi:MAG: bifunctional diguanylate cyclase/phosphodiesterase [Rhodobacteraceae bacterium]|nr:bifunctional diguanylate cyclase/phosphodiesterase [Paracoccaceae bacterium]
MAGAADRISKVKFAGAFGVLIACAIATLLIGWAGIDALQSAHVRQTIKREAEEKAASWAAGFVAEIPTLERILEGGWVSSEESQRISDSIAIGQVFRFELFSATGERKFISGAERFYAGASGGINQKAAAVYESGVSDISVLDGRERPGMPDAYVEAYLPADTLDGRRLGVIEVYVDVSAMQVALSHSFSSLSQYLLIGSALVFLAPAMAMLFRSRQLRRKDRKLFELSRYDHLTGAYNRRTLSNKLGEIFRSKKGSGGNGLLFIDVDHFKQINDTYGHEVGDQLLRHIARLLIDAVRSEVDCVGRYGGDEFVVVCCGVDHETLIAVSNRIEAACKEPFRYGGVMLTPSLSIGAYFSVKNDNQQSALRAADLAVYEAKRRGRGQMVEYYPALDKADERRRYVKTCLESAIEQELLTLYFQPIVDATSRKVAGFEGLLRLIDPEGGMISPMEFIPIAEETGLIEEIGLWTLQRGVRAATFWPEEHFLSINLSVKQLQNGDLPREVAHILELNRFPPERLELEVTETIFISDEVKIREKIQALKALGVSVSLDDFGSGYSSLGYLSRYSFDKIKIDRSLVGSRNEPDGRDSVLLNAIIAMGKALKVNVVAEGVETAAQLAMVTDGGADQIQGFLFSRPMPEEAIADFIETKEQDQPEAGAQVASAPQRSLSASV